MKKILITAACIAVFAGACYSLKVMNDETNAQMVAIVEKEEISEDEQCMIDHWYRTTDGVPSDEFITEYEARFGK